MRFETTTDLLSHQAVAVAKLLPSRVGALFMDLGTGKSRTTLELARVRAAKWDRLIWCCPVSAKETMRQEALKHTSLRADDLYVFDDRTRATTLPLDRTLYIVGIESLSSSARVTAALDRLITERSFVVADESTYLKGHLSRRTQRLTHLAARARYRLILTGTPITQGAVDLYAQMRFLSPQILGYGSFWSFAANHLEYETDRVTGQRTGRILRAHNEEVLAARMQPYVYQVRKDECLTLPDKLYERRWCDLTDEQHARYRQAKEEWLTLNGHDDWDGRAIYQLFTALQTIVCGWWRRTDPETGRVETLTLPHQRLDLLSDTLAAIPACEKVIIWAKYRRAITEIVARLTNTYGAASVAQFHGGLSEQARNAELARWRLSSDGARFLVATQSAGSHALTLTEAAYIVFYADSFKYAERIQAEDRCIAEGQLVMSERGLLPIEEINAGDVVLTHLGNWKSVLAVKRREHRGLMTTITYTRFGKPLVCTHDHRLLVKRGDSQPDWMEAHNVLPGDWLVMPRPKNTQNTPMVELPNTAQHSGMLTNNWGIVQVNGRYKPLPRQYALDDDLLWLFGWYLAEGFASITSDKGRFVSFSAHEKERPILERLQKTLYSFGVNSTIYTRDATHGIEMRAFSHELAHWFHQWFGYSSDTKIIPPLLLHLPQQHAQTLLKAYVTGDGYARKSQQEWISCSRALASQATLLALQSGFSPRLRQIDREGVNHGHWIGAYTINGAPDNPALAMSDEHFVYQPVRKVETYFAQRRPIPTMVYDLSVEDDHSFVVGLAAVHNCHRLGQARRPVYLTLATTSTIDTRIANALARKEDVLRVFQNRIERCRARGLKARAEQLVRAL